MLSKEEALKGVKLFVLDMDGTVYLGDQLIEGSLDFIRQVEASDDMDFVFFTNNASKVPSVYVEKLHKMGRVCRVPESKLSGSKSVSEWYTGSGRELERKGNPVSGRRSGRGCTEF